MKYEIVYDYKDAFGCVWGYFITVEDITELIEKMTELDKREDVISIKCYTFDAQAAAAL